MRRALAAVVLALACAIAPDAVGQTDVGQTDAGQTDPGRTDPGFRRDAWIADLDQLRDALSERYVNLEWQAERGLDLAAVYERARRRLDQARDGFQARRAFDRFLAAFADGHLEITWPTPAAGPGAPPGPEPLCGRLGYFPVGDQGAIATRLPGFRRVGAAGAHLPAGVVEIAGRRVGVLRVPIFQPQGFPDLCETLLAREGLKPDSPCDDTCVGRLAIAADTAFVGEMRAQLAAVVATRPDVLLIDVADNGGGNDSPLALAAMVTAKPVRKPRARLIRGEALERELATRQADVTAALATAGPAERQALLRFDAALTQARRQALAPCDRADLWKGRAIGCSALVDEPVYDGPLPPRVTGAQLPAWVEVASPAARFAPTPILWRGPLLILVDGNSASSSELFAAMLRDAGAALIVGAPTFGAGCGHMTDAGPVLLRNTGARVAMPDCLRLRVDGTNEAAAVLPDVAVGLRTYDTPRQRLDLVARALPSAFARAGR